MLELLLLLPSQNLYELNYVEFERIKKDIELKESVSDELLRNMLYYKAIRDGVILELAKLEEEYLSGSWEAGSNVPNKSTKQPKSSSGNVRTTQFGSSVRTPTMLNSDGFATRFPSSSKD